MSENTVSILQTERLQPQRPAADEQVIALSLLDATTANFALTNAIWLFENPPGGGDFNSLSDSLRHALCSTLDAYPWWCGRVKMVTATTAGGHDHDRLAAAHLPVHARRYGRLYAHYGSPADDPGVEVITATSSATLDSLYPDQRTTKHPIWNNGQNAPLSPFIPASALVNPRQPDELDGRSGRRKSALAVQITGLACGGWTLAVKSTHPLADITTLVTFVKDWARLHQEALGGDSNKPQSERRLEPWRVDGLAAGDINAQWPDADILRTARDLPFQRYDWWHPEAAATCPWPVDFPDVFKSEAPEPVGECMPWSEWDVAAPVSNCIIHLSRDQVEILYNKALPRDRGTLQRISRHDAVLAHVWSCIIRARGLPNDDEPLYCNLTYGLRPALKLGDSFIGSPIVMVNVEIPGREVSSSNDSPRSLLHTAAQKIRETITSVKPSDLGAHLHDVAFEKTPQRVWQAFLGRRHILVTTWARAGQYDIDFFGRASGERGIRYADGVMPQLDGIVLIKEAPPSPVAGAIKSQPRPSWTEHGVDVSIQLNQEAMERLVSDPLLLPALDN